MPLMLSASAGSAGPRGTPAKGKGCRGLPFCARFLNSIRSKTFWRFMRDTWLSNRLIMPNGRSIVLERQPGADAEGYAGLEDEVDNHWGMLFKAAIGNALGRETGQGVVDLVAPKADPPGTPPRIIKVPSQEAMSRELNQPERREFRLELAIPPPGRWRLSPRGWPGYHEIAGVAGF
jgi:Bacterial conjugation TrbI-like protein